MGPAGTRGMDRIERQVVLRAPRARVWRALSDAAEFGAWFRVEIEAPFSVGGAIRGRITYPGFRHLRMEAVVEGMEDGRSLAFRWHPGAIDPKVDYSKEPSTLVEFRLEDHANGSLLTIVESGFDRLPAPRGADAFRMNSAGWDVQLQNIRRHVEG